jgi:hypothetical protein
MNSPLIGLLIGLAIGIWIGVSVAFWCLQKTTYNSKKKQNE